jgi:TonB-linked SusC/RagA family outer membrane protein
MFILRIRFVKQLLVSASLLLTFNVVAFSQQRTVTGTVTSSNDGLPLIGVNVIIQGTTTGAITDLEGHYSLDISGGEISLQFSYIGYETRIISVGNSTVINVQLVPSLLELDEVVITSLGIPREKKRITYAAQNVETDNISLARELNVANSLQGRVAGMDVIKSSAGVGSATRIVLRGIRSMANNNQPLYIVDGVPIQNFTWSGPFFSDPNYNVLPKRTPDSEAGGVQSQDGIGNLNPDDIASITVLKGPNAVAVYGSRAANGAVVITTRQGAAREGIGVEFNTNCSVDRALVLTNYQQVYGQGNGGEYFKDSEEGWGPKMEGQMVEHWSPDPNWAGPATYAYLPHNNLEEFFQTGYNIANTLTLTSGSEKISSLFSYANTISQGIVETNKLRRHNFNLRVNGDVAPILHFDTKLTYTRQAVDNRLETGGNFKNIMRALYRQPSNISLEQARDFEYFNDSGLRLQHYWNRGTLGGQNVYWVLNRTIREETRDRILAMSSLRYNFTDNLSLMIRAAFDRIIDHWSYKEYYDTFTTADDGNLTLDNMDAMIFNSDFLLNYKKLLGGDLLSLDVSFGGNMLIQNSQALNTRTNRLLKPNLFVITNTSDIRSEQYGQDYQINSLYGYATLGLKNFLFLDLTGRNDWSSTLPPASWSYFYPSVGMTWILTDMLNTVPSFLTFAKLRANYTEVGNDTDPYRIHSTYSFKAGGQLGYAWRDNTLPAEDLKPEKTKSLELGFDARFLHNRMGLDFTWYRSNTFNQLIVIPMTRASGYQWKFINAGNIQNKGIEVTLNANPVRVGDFSWDVSFNYARNRNVVLELTNEIKEYVIRDPNWMTTIKVVEGETYGQIFTKGFKRNEEGRILIDDLGLPEVTPGQTMAMGHANPDWIGGLSNMFRYKGINLNILIDTRMGGDLFSFTEATLTSNGWSEATLAGREGMVVNGVVDVQDYEENPDGPPIYEENTIEITAEAYWHKLGYRQGYLPTGEVFRLDASYVRLREILLGYNFKINSNVIQGVNVALYGRNLGFLYNASKNIDPNMSVGTSNYQGVEAFGLPSSRTYGVNLRFTF